MSKITSCIFTSTILVCVLLISSCNLNQTVTAQLTVSSGNESNFSRFIEDHNCVSSVDGLRLWFKSITVEPSNGEFAEIWQSNKLNGTLVDLRSSVDMATITSQVILPISTIIGIQVELYDQCELKAFTYLPSNSTYYYTSANGVQSTSSFDTNDPPSDYDFFYYPFIYVGISETTFSEGVHYPETITIAEGGNYNFEIYIDLVNSVRFWDGDPDNRHDPFRVTFPEIEETFPDNVPAFALWNLPWCLVAYDTAMYSNPILETYLISQDITYFNTPTLVSGYMEALSFVFLSESSPAPIYGSVRGNFCITGVSGHEEWYSGFEDSGSNTFSFNSYPAEWFMNNYDEQYLQGIYNNFPHLSTGQIEQFTITKISGPTTTTWYAKRIK